jgi:hypothetical protein
MVVLLWWAPVERRAQEGIDRARPRSTTAGENLHAAPRPADLTPKSAEPVAKNGKTPPP